MYSFMDYRKILEAEATGTPLTQEEVSSPKLAQEEIQEQEESTPEEIAAATGDIVAHPTSESTEPEVTLPHAISSFDEFIGEAKKEKWIAKVNMEKGALRKEMKKKKGEEISPDEIEASEKKLAKKDKDKKKPGLQLNKKDAKTHKRNVLAKNLMKASGAMNESRKMKIQGAKDQLVKIHEVIEKMIKQTAKKK